MTTTDEATADPSSNDAYWDKRDIFIEWTDRAKKVLKTKNLATVAKKLGISANTLHAARMRHYPRKPSAKVLRTLTDLLGENPLTLLGNEGDKGEDTETVWPMRPLFNQWVEQAMSMHRLNKSQLAKKLGMAKAMLYCYQRTNYRNWPRRGVLESLAAMLGKDSAALAGEARERRIGIGRKRCSTIHDQWSLPERWKEQKAFSKLIYDHLAATGKTQAKLAVDLDIPLVTLQKFIYHDSRTPTLSVIERIASVLGIHAAEISSPPTDETEKAPTRDDNYVVPPANVAKAPTPVEYHLASTKWILRELRTDPKHLRYHDLKGNGMSPDLKKDDRVLVDISAPSAVFQEGTWLIAVGGAEMVRNVRMAAPSVFRAVPRNPDYAEFDLDENCRLLGRAVALIRRL